MKVINLFGGPCAGKSTLAAGLFYEMKKAGYSVELVTEYAKDMVWEDRTNIMKDQIYIFAKQYRRLSRLKERVDFVITDSPILMCTSYIMEDYYHSLEPLIYEVASSFDNVNFLLERSTKYQQEGRIQTEEQARQKDEEIKIILHDAEAEYHTINVGDDTISNMLQVLGINT